MSAEAIEQVVPAVAETVTADVDTTGDEQLPVRAHAAKYSEAGRQKEAEALANETPEQRTARQEAAAQQKRDRENGQFKPGKTRHRAASQQASPEDAPRISQLTARAKTAEERAERAERELAALRASGAPRTEIAQAEARVEETAKDSQSAGPSTFKEAAPKADDPKYKDDYGLYLEDRADWAGRKAYHEQRERDREEALQAKRDKAQRDELKTAADRMEAAKTRYADFDEVAYAKPAPWLLATGPIRGAEKLDQWIKQHRSGPDVLYYFQQEKNHQELVSLLEKPEFEQVELLALLSQRLLPESSSQAGVTGSAAGRHKLVTLPPKPPNPVRTEAQRTSGGPPPTDGSLGVLGHAKAFRKS